MSDIDDFSPSPVRSERVSDATAPRSLYLLQHGAALSWRQGQFIVDLPNADSHRIPANQVARILILANVSVTTPCLIECLSRSIPVVLASRGAKARGLLHDWAAGWLPLRRAQLSAADSPDACLHIARAIIMAKVANTATVLARAARHRSIAPFKDAADRLRSMRTRLWAAKNMNALRGYEGDAAHQYFKSVAQVLGPQWGFAGRARRPTPDPINALLSYGYAILYNHLATTLTAHGLLVSQGFLHSPRAGHAALASDLIEEFRAPIVDALVLKLLLAESIKPGEFKDDTVEPGRCKIPSGVRKRFIGELERKLSSKILHRHSGCRLNYRGTFDWQIGELRRYLLGERMEYRPFRLR